MHPSAVYTVLPAWVDGAYRAAGVLAYSYNEHGNLVFLLAEEKRTSTFAKGRDSFWNLLGGKRERVDRFAEDTAVREFLEESAGVGLLFRDALVASLASAECVKLWISDGRFVLYITPLPYVAIFPELFATAAKLRPADASTCITQQIKWIGAQELLSAAYTEHFEPCGEPETFYPFLLQMLRIGGMREELLRLKDRAHTALWHSLTAMATLMNSEHRTHATDQQTPAPPPPRT